MVRKHLPDKVDVNTVAGTGVLHFTEHMVHDPFDPGLIAAQILTAVVYGIAFTEDLLHISDTVSLFRDNLQGQILKRDVCGVP